MQDFEDLHRAALLGSAIPLEDSGLGLGPSRGNVFALCMATNAITKADLSLARCWGAHTNSMVLLDGMANAAQKALWFEGVVERGEKWVAWSGEPQARAPGETSQFGTYIEKVDAGYVLDGTKVFSTSSTGAQWAILLVNTEG